MADFAPCPKCGNTNATKIGFTWWGGVLGPKLLNHVKCGSCRTAYNGKSGKSNMGAIITYQVVILVVVGAIFVAIAVAGS